MSPRQRRLAALPVRLFILLGDAVLPVSTNPSRRLGPNLKKAVGREKASRRQRQEDRARTGPGQYTIPLNRSQGIDAGQPGQSHLNL